MKFALFGTVLKVIMSFQEMSLCLCAMTLLTMSVDAVLREFYIGAVEVNWDYAPTGRNLFNGNQSEADIFIQNGPDRIGSTYTKAVYKQYTDTRFAHEIPKEPWQGILGPILRAEVGDTIVINFRSFIRAANISLHPHGVLYDKRSEGSLYLDGTSGGDKIDDSVPPGGRARYVWNITENFAPSLNDDNCLPWAYHSHVIEPRDVDTGLVGLLVICKPGILGLNGRRIDVDKEFSVYMEMTDEGQSWYVDRNIRRCGNPRLCRRLRDQENTAFRHSNHMFHINGFTFGHLPGFDACEGERVVWYFMSLNAGAHTVNVMGQTMTVNHHRVDTVGLFPATFISANMIPMNPGRWLLHCRNQDHLVEGMTAFFNVAQCPGRSVPITRASNTRRYFIAVEEVEWTYAPLGLDRFQGGQLLDNEDARTFFQRGQQRIGGTYVKAVYHEFTDETFTRHKLRNENEQHLGLLGPAIKAEVGDLVEVVLLNRARRAFSFLPKGVGFTKDFDGGWYIKDANSLEPSGLIAQPGQVQVYRFSVPIIASPTEYDPNCVTYMYHSAVDLNRDIYSGLVGPLLICKPGSLIGEKQRFIDREFFLWMSVIDENKSWYIDENIRRYTLRPASVDKNNRQFQMSNRMHAINGFSYANLDGLTMCRGEDVSWHPFATGNRMDMHSVSFQGNNFLRYGQHLDTDTVFPGTSMSLYMKPDNAGQWALTCHVLEDSRSGMTAMYTVQQCHSDTSATVHLTGRVRNYYIAAEEVNWQYAPTKRNLITGKSLLEPDTVGYQFVRSDTGYIGSVYKKAIYKEYTDATFSVPKQRRKTDDHLGFMGPFIRAEVGDTIKVTFLNRASRSYSIKPHSVMYDKANEGMSYNDGSPFIGDNEVGPGKRFTYHWKVPVRSGPGPAEPNCVGSMYHSGTDGLKDTYSGLMGPLVICREGVLNSIGKRTDGVDKEFATLFFEVDENQSWYLQDNRRRFAPRRRNITDPTFMESNRMASINGFIYGNVPGLDMLEGDRVVWYVLGLGAKWSDIHTAHFHGQTFLHRTDLVHRGDVMEVFPGKYETVEMITDNPGTWIYHCHVGGHMMDGMEALYTINPRRTAGSSMSVSAQIMQTNLRGPGMQTHVLSQRPERVSSTPNLQYIFRLSG